MKHLFTTTVALFLLLAAPARAEGFASTNIQGLVGWGFEDSLLGYDTPDGSMGTITINHFSTWAWGDNFAFVDLLRGDFAGDLDAIVYAEWHPRLSLTKVVGRSGPVLTIFRDVYLAGEVNQGSNFYAYLGGLGVDFEVGAGNSLGLSLFYRFDKFVGDTWQVSPFWTFPFQLGPVPILFTGFIDVFGAWSDPSVDFLAQPQLLVDVLAPFGAPSGKVFVGIEWYLHYNKVIVPNPLVSAPQALLQWTWH